MRTRSPTPRSTEFAAIRYTEPFLNNQHIAEPTLYYLKNLATQCVEANETRWYDVEGNVIFKRR